jgi:hypothetical protein
MSKPHALKGRTGADSCRGGTGKKGAQITARVPTELRDRLAMLMVAQRITPTEAIILAIESGLAHHGIPERLTTPDS